MLSAAVLGLVVQVWVHLDWIGNSSEHCDFPGECLATWYPFAFAAATWLWLCSLVAGGLAWLHLARSGASVPALVRIGVAWVAAFCAFFLTPLVLPLRHGVIDIARIGGPPSLEGRYALAVLLLGLAALGFGWQLVATSRSPNATRAATRRRTTAATAAVALVLSAGAAVVVVSQAQRQSVATDVVVSQKEERAYLGSVVEMLEHRHGPRSRRVSDEVLLREGVTACRWLATRPGGRDALPSNPTRRAYFVAHPRVAGRWPFHDGRTSLRRHLLVDAWQYLCPDVYADHVSFFPPPGD